MFGQHLATIRKQALAPWWVGGLIALFVGWQVILPLQQQRAARCGVEQRNLCLLQDTWAPALSVFLVVLVVCLAVCSALWKGVPAILRHLRSRDRLRQAVPLSGDQQRAQIAASQDPVLAAASWQSGAGPLAVKSPPSPRVIEPTPEPLVIDVAEVTPSIGDVVEHVQIDDGDAPLLASSPEEVFEPAPPADATLEQARFVVPASEQEAQEMLETATWSPATSTSLPLRFTEPEPRDSHAQRLSNLEAIRQAFAERERD